MAKRFVYKSVESVPFVRKVPVEFTWFGGFSLAQKRRCIAALHQAYADQHPDDSVLEISSKSPEELGIALSAFNLTLELRGRKAPVECAFQGSKVFEDGGPYVDLFEATPRGAKRDPRLKENDKLTAFEIEDVRYPLGPKDAFYNWLWIHALLQHADLAENVLQYDAFTDIEFNPQKSINCQAIAAAMYVDLAQSGKLQEALRSFESFLAVAYGTGH